MTFRGNWFGARPGSLDGLRYGKICILADADSDGHHIATTLCIIFEAFSALGACRSFIYLQCRCAIDATKGYYVASDAEKIYWKIYRHQESECHAI